MVTKVLKKKNKTYANTNAKGIRTEVNIHLPTRIELSTGT